MDKPSIRAIIVRWADSYNNRIPVPAAPKRIAYLELLKTFIDNGYAKEDIDTTSVFEAIIEESVPSNYQPVRNRLIWTKSSERVLEGAMEEMFPTVVLSELTEEEAMRNVKSKIDYATRIENSNDKFVQSDRIVIEEDQKPKVIFDDTHFKELGFDE